MNRGLERKGSPERALRGVTVDFWGTLATHDTTERRTIENGRAEIWRELLVGGGLSAAVAARWAQRVPAWVHREERRGRAPTLDRQREWVRARTGVQVPRGTLRRRMDTLARKVPVRPLPGALDGLRALRRSGLRLALVSNVTFQTPKVDRALQRKLGFWPLFDVRAYSAELPWSKPDPRMYRWALRRLGVPASQAAHIGDLPLDREGARAAGMRAFLVRDGEREGPRSWMDVVRRILALAAEPGPARMRRPRTRSTRTGPGPQGSLRAPFPDRENGTTGRRSRPAGHLRRGVHAHRRGANLPTSGGKRLGRAVAIGDGERGSVGSLARALGPTGTGARSGSAQGRARGSRRPTWV